jgi:hypothetical protein
VTDRQAKQQSLPLLKKDYQFRYVSDAIVMEGDIRDLNVLILSALIVKKVFPTHLQVLAEEEFEKRRAQE